MAQPSIQHEPSMEEILASIRRIIEDSDPAHTSKPRHQSGDQGKAGADKDAGSGPSAPPQASNDSVVEVEAFREGLQKDAPPAAPRETSAPRVTSAPRSMADLHASLRHEPGKADEEASTVELAPEAPATTPAEPVGVIENNAAADDAKTNELGEWREIEEAQGANAAAVSGLDRPNAIISQKAGRQVAAAFEELSEAFAANRRRSFDEMAEDMLQPMLREWMDNNLPVLVERLVREEIERVARGVER